MDTSKANRFSGVIQLSAAPLSDRTEILRRIPTKAISPALNDLLDMLSSPVLLVENSPAGELREMRPAKRTLKEAA